MRISVVGILLLGLFVLTIQQEDVVFQQQFIEIEPTPVQTPSEVQQVPQIHAPITREPLKFDLITLQRFRYEVLAVSLVFLYLIIYVKGKNTNLSIMQSFYRRVDQYLQSNFAHIGFSKNSGEVPFNGQSPSESLYYATGRQNVDCIEMRFNTKKRQDLIYYLYDIVFPEKDIVTIDIPVKSENLLVFALASKKKIREMAETYLDLKKITGKFRVNNLNDSYEVLGESNQTLDLVFDGYITRRLNDMQGLFISMHYSDLKTYSNSNGHFRVILNATHKNPQQFLPAIELIFYIVDKIAGLKFSANIKTRAAKSREAYHQLKERQDLQKHNEQMRKKKQDKLRQEQAWIRSLPPQKQKKEEEKRKKKELNKLMKGKVLKM